MSIYLDYNATTPVAPEVRQAIDHHLRESWGNPSSTHQRGRSARAAIDRAREQIAELIGAYPDEIIFTSGGTESSNLAIRGAFARSSRAGVVTSAVEHPATIEPCRHLERVHGAELRVLPVDEFGVVQFDHADLGEAAVVTVMHANNEVGTLQPVDEIARFARSVGAVVHTDAAQSVGKVPIDVDELDVDLLTIAGHKLYAPKGIGALYVRRGTALEPVLRGAGHEGGLRPGTENTPYIAGLGVACELAAQRLDDMECVRELRDRLWEGLLEAVPGIRLNGHPDERLPNTLNVSFPGDARALMGRLPEVHISFGSACHDDVVAPSPVLTAMGFGDERALGAVRFSLGRETTVAEVDSVLGSLADCLPAAG